MSSLLLCFGLNIYLKLSEPQDAMGAHISVNSLANNTKLLIKEHITAFLHLRDTPLEDLTTVLVFKFRIDSVDNRV
jgi:hypothetical protein